MEHPIFLKERMFFYSIFCINMKIKRIMQKEMDIMLKKKFTFGVET